MERTVTLNDSEQVAIVIAFRGYLQGLKKEIDTGYHTESNIATAIRLYNKANNLRNGCDVDWDVDRIPTFLRRNAG